MASIIETIILQGKQEIALRGHRDHGRLSTETPDHNDGNFRALLRFRIACGDQIIKKHIEADSAKMQYTSPMIQNELIDICGNIIIEKIVSKMNSAECFTVLADETTDISGKEQFSLCARYVDDSSGSPVLREDFLKFVVVGDMTGKGLSRTLISNCIDIGLDLKKLVGQGYDGASSMRGHTNGCAAEVTKIYLQVIYIHCASHSLNLVVGAICEIANIRNTLDTVVPSRHYK